MESAIRWSPSSTASEQRFLSVDVTGKAFRLCRITGSHGRHIQHEVLSHLKDVPLFRAFDWSTSNENLVAVGQSSGEATILRLDADPKESLSFPVRNQRYCNAVAFSTHGLVASGLDRVRNDFCLNIWDVNQRLSPAGTTKGFHEPLRKLASSEPITSIKFFRDQPDTLVTGVKGQFVRIYDLREGPGNPSLQFPTRCVHNLAIDWLDENYIASCAASNESTVCVWDRRVGTRLTSPFVASSAINAEANQTSAVLQLKNVFDPKSSIWSLRFSKTNQGSLGALSSTGHLKTFDIAKDHLSEEYRSSIDETLGQGSFRNYPEPIHTKHIRDVATPFDHPIRGYGEKDRVVAFDFLNLSVSSQPSAIAIDGNGIPQIITGRPPCPPVALSSQGTLSCGISSIDSDLRSIRPLSEQISPISELVGNIKSRVLSAGSKGYIIDDRKSFGSEAVVTADPVPSRETRERALSLGTFGTLLTAKEALTLSTLGRFRCKEGYLFDEARNREIVSDDAALQDLWAWIERARSDSSGMAMVTNGLDLNYLGVSSVWHNDLGHGFEKRRVGSKADDASLAAEAIVQLAEQLSLPESKGCETGHPEHRRLCLRLCGAAQSYRELEDLVKALSAEGQHTKAAAMAVFQAEPKLAYLALRGNEPKQAHKLLAMAIAGSAKGDNSADWEETCAEISKELTDPYARAILALVSKGDWHAVINETTLPLKYRVEVALRWLPDDELSEYLKDVTTEAIQQGDVEGVVLTGLGHLAMGLFQSYIDKFNDIQTPVLAMSHTVPRIISNSTYIAKFEAWRETYRRQMNSWKLQLERARFDVGSRQFAVTVDGQKLIPPPPQQVSLTCNYCTQPLTQHDSSSQISPSTAMETVHPTVGNPLGSASMSGTVCPRCGRHMPRCGVCTLWLGSPDPLSRSGIAADAEPNLQKATEAEVMRRFVVFCIHCNHGFHANHARDWFMRHKVCPVAECSCICDR
ncbi:hypothetical protein N7454_009600 [Penicillium verhagenii]|nr:hypothetical protein N7454_009600 [Penicillium verhagenii]